MKTKIKVKIDKVKEIKEQSRVIPIKPTVVAPLKEKKKRYNKPTPEDLKE